MPFLMIRNDITYYITPLVNKVFNLYCSSKFSSAKAFGKQRSRLSILNLSSFTRNKLNGFQIFKIVNICSGNKCLNSFMNKLQ